MRFNSKLLLPLLVSIPTTLAAVNGKCSGVSGICISTANCSKYGGKSISNRCPSDPNNIKCCQKITCKSGNKTGTCMFSSECKTGNTVSGLCPGGSDFKCCLPKATTTKKVTKKKTTTSAINNQPTGNVKSLVTSLLIFEEGVGENGVCGAYIDSRNFPTIGYGKLCENKVVQTQKEANAACSSLASICTKEIAKQWLSSDIDSKTSCIQKNNIIKKAYDNSSNKRKAILTSMAYQMGCNGLAGFKKFLTYMANSNWSAASTEMLDSAWARQTPDRAERHSYVIKNNNCGPKFCSDYKW